MKFYGIIILVWLLLAPTAYAEAADLKCVTIHFKNDSELKLKTQWHIAVRDTTGDYWFSNSPDSGYVKHPEIICRYLLFPPQIRREPTSRRVYNDDGSWNNITRTVETDTSVMYYMIPVRDTTAGKALLWYEERKSR